MEIRIFGPGCSRCKELEARTREALGALDRDASVVKVEDIMEIAAAGALRTPAMQINGAFYESLTREKLDRILDDLKRGAQPTLKPMGQN